MDITIFPGTLSGSLTVIPSKSQAHRLLICAAFADRKTILRCPETNRDIEATAQCLRSLGAKICHTKEGYTISPVSTIPNTALLPCQDSGSTLRFLLPVAGALGVDATFQMEGRLPERPLSPLWEEMEAMGCQLSRPTPQSIRCTGKLKTGKYQIDGGVSSQFVTGLLLAAALIPGESQIVLTGKVESKPYITMTQQAMALFGCSTEGFSIQGGQALHSPGTLTVEGDWSGSAFFLGANALGSRITVKNLSLDSPQGDRAIMQLLPMLEDTPTISVAQTPDLVPILAVVAACKKGAVFTDVRRLRLKESDRVASILAMLTALGGRAEADENTLTVYGTGLTGGKVDSANDHRIAMAAAIAATTCLTSVTILGGECIQKSYPRFWEEFARLGGLYEQHLW